ncbi:MAG TPA: primosomal protein N' [Tepidisphaeraceae bacterium]|nr:primosomal protein N' [Tepidisphaeraceae bacterium]
MPAPPTTSALFDPPDAAAPVDVGPFAVVALERGIDRVLDYRVGTALAAQLQVGQRVRVPLGRGNKPARGYVVEIRAETQLSRTKEILAIEDSRALIAPKLLELARWMSRYYVTPLGMVLQSVIPSAVKKKRGLERNRIVRLSKTRQETQEILEQTKSAKRRQVLARLLLLGEGEKILLARLASEAGTTVATIRKLAKDGTLSIETEDDLPGLIADLPRGQASEVDLELNEDQKKVFDELLPRMAGGFTVNLIHGVTGSGKTEIYLQCIRRVIEAGKQALVLVPEIALTPQTVRRFQARFSRVAILHSGLSDAQRHAYWQQISAGAADIVVGARSAVFAPLKNLGVIVVDEEHEPSYKQDTAPRYHGRDIGIKRGQIEGVPVILGSATPSLESYFKARSASPSSYLLSLPRRVRGLSMPTVELVDMRVEGKLRRGMHLLSRRLEFLLRQTIDAGHQAILLLNRRGYSNFVYCASCNQVVQCKYCDATMTYHRWGGPTVGSAATGKSVHTGNLICHYCLAVNPLPEKCDACGKKLSLFGLGTQRVEEELARHFPDLKFARVDSDTMRSGRDYEQLLGRFARGEIQVMLGTQMIAKGLDYPNVTLVGVISGDTALALPDFRAAERTFQLITQVAGRAGRGDSAGRVVLQTFLPDDSAIACALRQDFPAFAEAELARRREVGLPPFSRLARIIVRGRDAGQMHSFAEALAADVSGAIAKTASDAVRMKGPMPCAVSRVAGYWRDQIVLYSQSAQALQTVLTMVRENGKLTRAERVAVDVDPVSLL